MPDSRDRSEKSADPLTEREQEILICLLEGFSNREIANRLHLAYQTVKSYNSEIYSKLGVSNREDAVTRARTLGLFDGLLDNPLPKGKHNLPVSVTGFVGRKQEIHDILQLLRNTDTRLITILAAGGMGKTRLSQEIARTQIGHYVDGVFFVALAPLSSPNDIVTAIAENIGFIFHGEGPAQQLINFLKEREILLILDNFEHLLDGSGLVSDIIELTSNIKIIVTSRERLNLRSETVYILRELHFSTWETPDDALEYDAVKLFMQSAQRLRADFELHSGDLDFLARICHLTGGMPLGIELAAGWVDVLSLEHIAHEIQQGIDILETNVRDIPARHRSMRATFERTWNRLTADEQMIFARLAVFRGGFTLESAEVITNMDVRHLRTLAQKALIQAEANERYAIHELLRQFGESKLAETSELPAMRAKHAQYFAEFMAARKHDIKTGRQLEAARLIEPDYQNIRVAWFYMVDHQSWEQLPNFLLSFRFYWDVNALGQDAMSLLEPVVRLLRTLPPTPEIKLALGRVLGWYGWVLLELGLFEQSVTICQEAIDLLQPYDSPDDLLATHQHLLYPTHMLRQLDSALAIVQTGLRVARSAGDPYWEAVLQYWFSAVIGLTGDLESAVRFGQQAVDLCENLGIEYDLAEAQMRLSWAYLVEGKYQQATYWIEKSLDTFYLFDKAALIGDNHYILGAIAYYHQNHALALQQLRRAIQVWWDAGYTWIYPSSLLLTARIYADQHLDEKALRLLAATMTNQQLILSSIEEAPVMRDMLAARMDPDRFDEAWSQGGALGLNELITQLLSELPAG